MYRRSNLFAVLLLAGALAQPLLGVAADRDQPIHIQADRVTLDERSGRSTYSGNVELTQGSTVVTADTIVVVQVERELHSFLAEGKPAHFRQRPEGREEEIHARAERVEYLAATETLQLTGNAELTQALDRFSGHQIEYDMANSVVRARSENDDRVRAVIHPRSDERPAP